MKKLIKKNFDCGGNAIFDNVEFMDMLGLMLEWNPGNRMAPQDALMHKFLQPPSQQ